MEEYYRKIRSLSPQQQQILGQRFSNWFASRTPGEKSLALFYVPKEELSPQEVRAYLEDRVPDHLLPAEVVRIDELPRTINGKIDRQALLTLRSQPPQEARKSDGPATLTETERKLAEIWSGILDVAEIDREDSFFQLGGHSLLATQVIMEIEQVFGLQVPLNTIFVHRTLAQFSRHLDESAQQAPAPEEPVQPEAPSEGIPLSNAQRRLWYISQLSDQGLEYKIVKVLDMEGRLNLAAVSQAISEIVRRHETLRTRFGYVAGKLVQTAGPVDSVAIEHVDLSGFALQDAEKVFDEIGEKALQRPFDLETGPLMRLTLIRYSDSRLRLIFDAHHIVIDGWSVGILVQELNSLFRSFSQGSPSQLAPLPAQYRHYALAEKQRIDQQELDRQIAYWRTKLGDAPELEFRRPRVGASPDTGDGEIDFELEPDVTDRISQVCGQMQITPFMFLLSVYHLLLSIHTTSRDIAIGTDVANRDSKDHAGLIGFFVNQLVLRVRSSQDMTFRQLCSRTRECVEEAFGHMDIPYDSLVRELRMQSAQRSLFRAKFTFHQVIPDIAIEGIRTDFIDLKPKMGKIDLLLNLEEGKDGLAGNFEYSGSVFDRAGVERLIDHYKRLCGLAVEDIEAPASALADAIEAADLESSRRLHGVARESRRKDLRKFLESQRAGTP